LLIVVCAASDALAALGVWVSNNWAGIKQFFSAFDSSFMNGLGGANGPLGTMVGHLSSAYSGPVSFNPVFNISGEDPAESQVRFEARCAGFWQSLSRSSADC
jgi:hypothetical protein